VKQARLRAGFFIQFWTVFVLFFRRKLLPASGAMPVFLDNQVAAMIPVHVKLTE
jgi:hypothetical protein